MNSSGIWRPDWCKAFEKEGPALTPPPPDYDPPVPSQPMIITQRHGTVPPSTLLSQQAPCSETLHHSLYVNMKNTSDTHSAGSGVISCSVVTVEKGFRLG